MVFKANDRCTSSPGYDEFRGPQSDFVRQVALAQQHFQSRYNLKKRPPPQPRIEITTVGDLYAYLEAEKLRYVRAKFHNERLNEKRMMYVLKEKPFNFDFR
ncbi:hypothetical protein TNCV_408571 [Trichonephila clavipes]|nr:hypothetical protein TNCV_408571 [Trichonephila clavipes]